MPAPMLPTPGAAIAQSSVNMPGAVSGLNWMFYDTVAYAAVGQSLLQFFQTPTGQSGKTNEDTNMTNAGLLPQGQRFLVQTLEFQLLPGSAIGEAGLAAAAVSQFLKDMYVMAKTGWVSFIIGSMQYSPGGCPLFYPPSNRISGFAAMSDQTTAAASELSNIDYGQPAGAIFRFVDGLYIESNKNFNVSINYPTVTALPSGTAGKIRCKIGGVLYRDVQG